MVDPLERSVGLISRSVEQALTAFADTLEQQSTPKDGVLTARVVGEFSAGKTRLLRELLSDYLPESLFPVSSPERQTRLQLEITYGNSAQLSVVQRAADHEITAIELQRLVQFPERHELTEFDPMQNRLRLAVPDSRLILPNGDGFSDDTSAKRLFLIDTPGWNSGDDALAESPAARLLTGYHNLSLVYVTQAGRVDSSVNEAHLNEFLDAFEDADFIERHSLVFVITHCTPDEADHLRSRAEDRVLTHWQALGHDRDDLALAVLCVDFETLQETERREFRETFWHVLLAPLRERAARLGQADMNQAISGRGIDPWSAALRRHAPDWSLASGLTQTHTLIVKASQLLSGAIKEGDYIAGMNRYRLLGLDREAAQIRLRQVWWRQLGCTADELLQLTTRPPTPDEQHPLGMWWRNYWQAGLDTCLGPVVNFFDKMDRLIDGIDSKTEDIQAVLKTGLTAHHQAALAALDSSFVRLVETAQQHVTTLPIERATATLLTLSLLEARYRDHYIQAQKAAA